jgi:hypothetical protein
MALETLEARVARLVRYSSALLALDGSWSRPQVSHPTNVASPRRSGQTVTKPLVRRHHPTAQLHG